MEEDACLKLGWKDLSLQTCNVGQCGQKTCNVLENRRRTHILGPGRAERLPGGVEDAEPAVDLLAGEEVPDGEVGAADERGADGLGGQSRWRRQRQGTTEPAARKRAAARMKLELDGLTD